MLLLVFILKWKENTPKFDKQSDAEKYIEPENKKYRDNNDDDWFYRVVPFKIRIPLHNIDNP